MDTSSNLTITGAMGPRQAEGTNQGPTQDTQTGPLGGGMPQNPSMAGAISTGLVVSGGGMGSSGASFPRIQPGDSAFGATSAVAGGTVIGVSSSTTLMDAEVRARVDDLLRSAQLNLHTMDDQIREFNVRATGVAGQLNNQNDQRRIEEIRSQMEDKRERMAAEAT